MEDRRSANASNIFYALLCGHNINIKLFTKLSRSQIQSRSLSNFQPCRPTSLVHCRPLKTNVAKYFGDISTHAKKMCLSNSANYIESYNTMRG